MPEQRTLNLQERPSSPVGVARQARVTFDEETWGYGPYKRFPDMRERLYDYLLMRKYEPTVRRVLVMLRGLIITNIGEYHHEDERIDETVTDLLGGLQGGIQRVLSQLMSSFWAGFAVLEPVWQTRPNAWYIERTELIHPLSLFPAHSNIAAEEGIRYDPQTGDIVITQYPPEVAAAPVTWSANELIYWPLFPELKEEVYGNSLLAGARRPWYAKVKLENYWNTYGEKQAMSTPVFRAPLDLLDDPENPGDQITWVEYLTRFYERLLPGQAMAIGLDKDASFDVTELGVKGTSDFAPLVDYWTDQLYAAMITPRLLFDEPKHASRGQTESVAETFYMLMDAIRRELGRVLIEQVVRPLIVYNLGEQEHYGEWRWAPMQVPDLDGLSAILERVERARATGAMAGYPLTEADERHLRETFGDLYVGYDEAYPGGQVNPFEFADAGGGSVARPNPPRRYLG